MNTHFGQWQLSEFILKMIISRKSYYYLKSFSRWNWIAPIYIGQIHILSNNSWMSSAVVVVNWSVWSPYTPTIQSQIPLKSRVFSVKYGCEKNENKQKEAGVGPSLNLVSAIECQQIFWSTILMNIIFCTFWKLIKIWAWKNQFCVQIFLGQFLFQFKGNSKATLIENLFSFHFG